MRCGGEDRGSVHGLGVDDPCTLLSPDSTYPFPGLPFFCCIITVLYRCRYNFSWSSLFQTFVFSRRVHRKVPESLALFPLSYPSRRTCQGLPGSPGHSPPTAHRRSRRTADRAVRCPPETTAEKAIAYCKGDHRKGPSLLHHARSLSSRAPVGPRRPPAARCHEAGHRLELHPWAREQRGPHDPGQTSPRPGYVYIHSDT